jgi:hypothetical protein
VAEDQEAPVLPKEMVFQTIKSNPINTPKKQDNKIKSHAFAIKIMLSSQVDGKNLPANNRNQNIIL